MRAMVDCSRRDLRHGQPYRTAHQLHFALRSTRSKPADRVTRKRRRSHAATSQKEEPMTLGTILLIILILVLVGALPTWPHSQSWGYGPSGALGTIVVILIILVLMGRL
jgi:hypothetical protein